MEREDVCVFDWAVRPVKRLVLWEDVVHSSLVFISSLLFVILLGSPQLTLIRHVLHRM